MTYSNKIALIIKNDLLGWQKLNVASFLTSAVAVKFPEVHGRPFVNASGSQYLPFIKHPVLVYQAEDELQLKRAFLRARDRNLHIGIYTEPLFATKNEEENHVEILKYTDDEQPLVGLIMYGENKAVNKALDGLKFHP